MGVGLSPGGEDVPIKTELSVDETLSRDRGYAKIFTNLCRLRRLVNEYHLRGFGCPLGLNSEDEFEDEEFLLFTEKLRPVLVVLPLFDAEESEGEFLDGEKFNDFEEACDLKRSRKV